jgi:pimeloyl-ACP methyl ester carboxylesterase
MALCYTPSNRPSRQQASTTMARNTRTTTNLRSSAPAGQRRIAAPALICALALIALLAPHALRAAPPAPRFAPNACPFAVPKGLSVRCGTLTVPEDRARPDGPAVRLPVAIARAAQTPALADPVLYLSGGPGSPALSATPSLAGGWAAFLQRRDLIVVDQRGTGRARPSLDCPETDAVRDRLFGTLTSAEARRSADLKSLADCGRRLARAGVNLAAYSTAANAADMRDLRLALGYEQWNVFGISYGTRLAMELARIDREGTRSLVLDSVYPPQANLFTAMPTSFDAALRELFAANAGLEQIFFGLADKLSAKPASLKVRDPRTGAMRALRLDARALLELTYAMLHSNAELPRLPAAIRAAAGGRYGALVEMQSRKLGREGAFSEAMYYTVECSSDLARTTPEATGAAANAFPRLAPYFAAIQEFGPGAFDLCARWGIAASDSDAPLASDVPALILAGAGDPITPPGWAHLAASTLPRAEVRTFSATGHAVITRGGCVYALVAGFLEGLDGRGDAGCGTR